MRNSKTIKINQRLRPSLTVTAFELSVGQIIGLFFAARELSFPADQEKLNTLVRERIFNDLGFVAFSDQSRVKNLNQAEKIQVENFFYQVNADFFSPKPADNYSQYAEPENFTGEFLYQDFIKLIWINPALIDYPYSVVKVMMENGAEWKAEMSDGE